ncbi:MAG: NAD-dependent epimerase/dehydratase family protein, partial [Pseudobdellovibrio sp.]
AGFLGSHLSEYYLKNDFTVYGLDNFCTGSESNIDYLKKLSPHFHFFEKDVSEHWFDLPRMEDLRYVFHFASPASPPHYQKLALETLWVNTTGLNHALHFADYHKARVVFASTSEIYGDPEFSPQPESYWGNVNSFGERSCYDEAKRFGEALIFSHNKKFMTHHGLVRIFNTYGPRMNPNDGRVVINFILQALQNVDLTVYGDGLQTRSFCYVDDLISGISKYADAELTFPVNIGNDREFNMLELADVVLKAVPSKSQLLFKDLPSDDPKKRRPDLSLAKKHLAGWQPSIALEDGVKRMADWLKAELHK